MLAKNKDEYFRNLIFADRVVYDLKIGIYNPGWHQDDGAQLAPSRGSELSIASDSGHSKQYSRELSGYDTSRSQKVLRRHKICHGFKINKVASVGH